MKRKYIEAIQTFLIIELFLIIIGTIVMFINFFVGYALIMLFGSIINGILLHAGIYEH